MSAAEQHYATLLARADGKWQARVGTYRKLRFTSDTLIDTFAKAGLRARIEQGPRGMLRLVADA